jgi:hypothetical protein
MYRRAFMIGSTASMAVGKASAQAASTLLIDGFTSGTSTALSGNRWMGFTDQVMGGRSTGTTVLDEINGRPCIRLTGTVNTQGGGFIQLAIDLGENRKPFDGRRFNGVELDVYGNGEEYNCHLRTTDVRWYEQSYRASFVAPQSWTTVKLPWSAFEPSEIETPLNLEGLLRLGILGWMRDFEADIAVGRLSLY